LTTLVTVKAVNVGASIPDIGRLSTLRNLYL